MEVLPTIDALHWIAARGTEHPGRREDPACRSSFLKTKRSAFTYEPLGVIGVISPWNYPWSIPFGEVALALMAGNGVVLKPASLTPLIGERIARVFERAGVPEGLVRVVHGPGTGAGAGGRRASPRSSSPGRSRPVAASARRVRARLKGSVLELGGKDPMIVLADANLDHAVAGALWGGFANAGQTCSGIERVYVHARGGRALHRRRRRRRPSACGSATRWTGTPRSARWSRASSSRLVRELVDDAVGGRRRAALRRPGRGRPASSGGVLRAHRAHRCHPRDADHARGDLRSRCCRSWSWTPRTRRSRSPTTPSSASAPRSGPRDRAKGERIARELESGMVWINDHMFSHGACQCSWGGVKDSGLGPHALEVRPLRVRQRQAARVGALAPCATPGGTPTTRRSAGRCARARPILYGRPSIRAGAARTAPVPLLKLGPRLARDAVRR